MLLSPTEMKQRNRLTQLTARSPTSGTTCRPVKWLPVHPDTPVFFPHLGLPVAVFSVRLDRFNTETRVDGAAELLNKHSASQVEAGDAGSSCLEGPLGHAGQMKTAG